MAAPYFTQATLDFLRLLSTNNNREWFQDNKQLYEEQVRTPALALIEDFAPALQLISPRFRAIPKKVGGSLMRVYRDTRFAKDKTPYKTNIGIHFRHDAGKDVHAPGYYLHIEPDKFFLGAGIWRPDSKTLGKIRDRIHDKGDQWLSARDDAGFSSTYSLNGGSLKNAPRGFARDHPQLQDLKRKDFIAICDLASDDVLSSELIEHTVERFDRATPYMQFLCKALEVGFD